MAPHHPWQLPSKKSQKKSVHLSERGLSRSSPHSSPFPSLFRIAANQGAPHDPSEVPLLHSGRWSSSHSPKTIAANRRAPGGTKWHEVVRSGTEWLEREPGERLSDCSVDAVVS